MTNSDHLSPHSLRLAMGLREQLRLPRRANRIPLPREVAQAAEGYFTRRGVSI